MGRLLTSEYIEKIGTQTHTAIEIWEVGSTSISDFDKQIISKLSDREKFYIHEVSSKTLAGYTTLNDIQQKPLLLLKVIVDRNVSQMGNEVSLYSFWLTIIVALVAGIVGTVLFPPIGGFIAIPIAIFLLELLRVREWRGAWRATRGLAVGWGLSFLVRFGIGLVMIAIWLGWAIYRQ